MNTLLKLVVFFFINVVVLALIDFIFGAELVSLLKSPRIIVTAFYVVLAGGFFAYLTFTIDKSARRNTALNYSLIIITAISTISTCAVSYFNWRQERYFANREANADYFKYYSGENEYEERLAFEALSKKFTDANDFKLVGNTTLRKDSVIQGEPTSVYHLNMFYQKRADKNYYKAVFTIIDNQVNLVDVDQNLDLNEYSLLIPLTHHDLQTMKNSLRKLPDSVRLKIEEELPDLK